MLIYCDSVILISYLDHAGPLNAKATSRLMAAHGAGDQLAVSDLTRLECRVMPLRVNDVPTLTRFDNFFLLPTVRMVPLATPVFDRATEIRARHRYKTPDAIHLAAAVEAGCDRFLTHDLRLAGFPDIAVEVLA